MKANSEGRDGGGEGKREIGREGGGGTGYQEGPKLSDQREGGKESGR